MVANQAFSTSDYFLLAVIKRPPWSLLPPVAFAVDEFSRQVRRRGIRVDAA